MMRDLLIRGMIAGIFAAILVTLFARVFAEPQVDRAIAYETAHEAQEAKDHGMAMAPEPELVSRAVQKSFGLATAALLYGAAVGGIFSLVFAVAYGRIGRIGPRSLALLLAIGAFVAIAVVPSLKYPPNPPAVGLHDTVAFRTMAYFSMIALSIVALVIAIKLGRGLSSRFGTFNGMLIAGSAYILLIVAAQFALPEINEVPVDFPAILLWKFRVAALEIQAVLWTAIGLSFGVMAERVLRQKSHRA